MANEPWTGDLLGYREVQVGPSGTTKLPRRGILRLLSGFTAADDPVNGVTTLIAAGGGGGGGGASDSDSVLNLQPAVEGSTLTAALLTLWTAIQARATSSALSALQTVVNGKAAQTALDALSTALKAPTYIVRDASSALDNELVLEGQNGVSIDYGTAGKAIVRGSGAAGAPVGATYLVQTADDALTNERVLEGDGGAVTVAYATAGKAKVKVALATTSSDGLMSASDKVALAGAGAGMTPAQVTQLDDATAATTALKAPTYLVQTASSALDNERALVCTAPVSADWATPGQVTLSMPAATTSAAGHMTAAHATTIASNTSAISANTSSISANTSAIAALKAPTYLVQTATSDLDNERTLEGDGGPVSVDFGTAGKAKITVALATTSTPGLMSAADKTALASAGAGMTSAQISQLNNASSDITALKAPTYIVQTATSTLDNELTLEGDGGPVTVDFGTAGKAKVKVASATTSADGLMSAADKVALAGKADVDVSVVTVATATLTLSAAHRGKLIVCTYAGQCVITIPKDATANLGNLFCTAVSKAAGGTLSIISETTSGGVDTPVRDVAVWSDPTVTPKAILAATNQPVSMARIGADEWLITGNYVP